MNQRERTALIFIVACLALGTGATVLRSVRQARARNSIVFADSAALVDQVIRPGPINLNSATAAELQLLPGIGPVLAQRIVEYRGRCGPFRRVADLQSVTGIGPKRLALLAELVTVGSDSVQPRACGAGR